jgi:putative ABC transport system permease protein
MATYLCWPAFFTKAYQLETKVFSTWFHWFIY